MAEGLGTLDQVRITRGRLLFNSHRLACHGRIDRADPRRRIAAQIIGLDVVKTDPLMARNSVNHSGYSGILRSLYVGTNVGGDMLIPHQAPVANLLAKARRHEFRSSAPDPDKWFFNHWLSGCTTSCSGIPATTSNRPSNRPLHARTPQPSPSIPRWPPQGAATQWHLGHGTLSAQRLGAHAVATCCCPRARPGQADGNRAP